MKVCFHALLTSALDAGGLSAYSSGHFKSRETVPGTQWIEGWLGPSAALDSIEKRIYPAPAGTQTRISRLSSP
jgi:hypothetical protein